MSTAVMIERVQHYLPPTPHRSTGQVTLGRVIASEWVKLRSLRSTGWTLLAAVAAIIGLGILFSYLTTQSGGQPAGPGGDGPLDPTGVSLGGVFLAQLAVGVLGVLVVSGEYATGMIRSTFIAVPKRLPVLWAKSLVFSLVTFVLTAAASVTAFFAGQAVLSGQDLQTSLSAPGVTRAVVGAALYLTVVGLLGVALGWLLRSTAGAISALFGLLLVLPIIGQLLPASWGQDVTPYLPSNAGQAIMSVVSQPSAMAPWTGFGLFAGYTALALAAAAVVLKRRDA